MDFMEAMLQLQVVQFTKKYGLHVSNTQATGVQFTKKYGLHVSNAPATGCSVHEEI
jgi:hypothetical protein